MSVVGCTAVLLNCGWLGYADIEIRIVTIFPTIT
jgi:hypothetical protein